MLEWLSHLTKQWPNVGLFATLLIGVYLLARYLSQAEVRDMRSRIEYLDDQVRALRYRDECYFAYILYDQNYHIALALVAAQQGFLPEKHLSFLEFREKWMLERGLKDEQEEIWK